MKLPRSIENLDVEGKTVFLRADLNVPMADGKISDSTRIEATLPTIRYLLDKGAAVVIASHLGRPGGTREMRYSLKPVADELGKRTGGQVAFATDCIGTAATEAVGRLEPGEALLLENLRFHQGEEENDPGFAQALNRLAELYVNDAFGASHRAHASIDALPRLKKPGETAAGFLLLKEVEFLRKIITVEDTERPFIAILGGAKIKGKIEPLEALSQKADALLIGGGMANTFVVARGGDLGRSLVDEDSLDFARKLLDQLGDRIVLPVDMIVTTSIGPPGNVREVSVKEALEDDEMVVDIGKRTVEEYAKRIAAAQLVFWNGPMGVFEQPRFAEGTFGVARAVAASPALSIVGGGESVEAVGAAGVASEISHISTGGGASLELISGATLPGVDALTS